MVVADIRFRIAFELLLPFSNRFGIAFSQTLYFIVLCQKTNLYFSIKQADQFGFFEVNYISSFHLSVHFGAPFFVGLQVNDPYFIISTVSYNNLLRTDHLNLDIAPINSFDFLPQQNLSVTVSVEKNINSLPLSTIVITLLSLLLHQKHKRIVEGSERIVNFLVLLSEADRKCFLLKHLSIN